MAGFHEQAIFDANCQCIVPSSPVLPTGDNLNHRDHKPTYDMNRMLQLLQDCLYNDEPSFWAKVSHDHQFKVTLTDASALRTGFVDHLFSGTCVLHNGDGCKTIVNNERWPHSMGIRVIDSILEWVEQGSLSVKDFVCVCAALGITSTAGNKKRSLRTKLVDRRRQLLDVADAAALSLTELLPQLGSSSSMRAIKSVGAAHGVEISDDEAKISGTAKILDHVTQGNCVREAVSYSPGCERLKASATLQYESAVHLQVSVLQHIVDKGSKAQLIQVLEILEIDGELTAKKKTLRASLKKYIQKIGRGKLKDVEAEFDVIRRLRELDEIRRKWPRLVPMAMKEKIITDFRKATSSAALASFTCACCARDWPIHERIHKEHSSVDLDLLASPTTHWNDSTFSPPPTAFSSGPLKGKLVDPRGVIDHGGSITLELCGLCSRGLHRGSLPKHALANKLYTGPVPEELSELTTIEECVIARARAKSWIVKLQEQESDSASPTAQRGLKGHTIIYPQQPDKLATVLPPTISDTLTFICVIFVGSSKLTKEWLREKAKPLVIRREKVCRALIWLRTNNPLYKDIEINEENLEALPVEDVLPYHVEHVVDNEAQDALVSRYDNGDEQAPMAASATHFQSVVVADVDAHTPANQLSAAAVRHAKTKGKPFVQVGHGPVPVNEFFNVDLFPMLYPTLFPYGCGGFEDRKRTKRISLKEHVKYLFSLHDRRFQTHNSFLFSVFNILQRRALLLGCNLKVKKATFNQFAKSFSSVSSEAVTQVLERIERGDPISANTDEERKVLRLMKEVNLITSKVPGSSAARVAMRNEIRALTMTHGMPSFYVTINPADAHNPIVKFLAGAEIDIDNMLDNDVPKYWEQSILISSNPCIGATFFNRYLKAFITAVLGYKEGEPNEGVLGVVKAHYGCVEAQGRGSLHCHMLVWVEGALNPNEIRDKVMRDVDWGKRLLEYLDDTITNVVPEDPTPDQSMPLEDKDPCTRRGVTMGMESIHERLGLRMKDISQLAERVQRHRHSYTCYKHYKAGEARTCRFDLKEDNFRADSAIDPESGQVTLRCLDGLVNNFNMTMLEAVRCNMDIQFIGSGESAKAMIYYITDYITKSQLKSHVAYAALQLAVKKYENANDIDDDFTVQSKRLLQKCAHAMISHQEMSAQQVVSYLMDYEDHFTSHEYSCLYWASFERYIERCDHEKLCHGVKYSREEGDDDDDNHDVATGEHDESGDEATENDTDTEAPTDEEEVMIRVNDQGEVTMFADQVSDYTLQPHELEVMCLWDFVAKTEKVYGCGSDGKVCDEPVERVNGTEDEHDDVEDEAVNDLESECGRKRVQRYQLLPEHKESGRKHIRLRKRNAIPVPIGPAMPRRDHAEAHARYCRLMLILFKPWRMLSELRESADSWESTFEIFRQSMDIDHQHVLNNMQVMHECRDSRNDHMQTRMRTRLKSDTKSSPFDGAPGNEIEEVDMTEVLEHLEDIDRMASRRNEETDRDAQQCLDELANAGFFDVHSGSRRADSNGVTPELLPAGDDTLEDEWRDTYEKRKAAWKLETIQWENNDTTSTTSINCIGGEDVVLEDVTLVGSMDTMEEQGDIDDGLLIMRRTADGWTLNREQRRAFEIVAEHTMKDKPEQLLMYLGGPGGTGKSRVVNALRDFFETRKQTRRFRLAAYTGVAARNIGGATLHALLQLSDSKRDISAKTKRDLAAMWDGVDYLFIDELSMIGCEMLQNISRALTEAKGMTTAFGGVNVILAGDFAQLPPIGDTRLYKDINTTSSNAGVTNRAQGKILGRLLWLSFEAVVILHETMRQSGSENDAFVDLLGRLRDGVCNGSDFDMLSSRCMRLGSLPDDDSWKSAPVVVTNNASRDAINRRAAEVFAERAGKELHWYHAIDTHRKNTIRDEALIEKLEGQHSGQTKHRLRRIPLAIGMPVAINQNFDVTAGVVNGSYGYLRKVRYFTDNDGRRYLKSCVVEIPDSVAVEIPHLPPHHFPILPDTTELKFEHGGSHKRCTIKRKQVPIEPGFAITSHKAQGKTMDRVIIDLAGCIGTEQPYVMVSRATSLNGVVVLRDFESRQISKRRSEESRKEFSRLASLKWQTIARYGNDMERKEAKENLMKLQGRATGGVKRGIGSSDGNPASKRKKLW